MAVVKKIDLIPSETIIEGELIKTLKDMEDMAWVRIFTEEYDCPGELRQHCYAVCKKFDSDKFNQWYKHAKAWSSGCQDFEGLSHWYSDYLPNIVEAFSKSKTGFVWQVWKNLHEREHEYESYFPTKEEAIKDMLATDVSKKYG